MSPACRSTVLALLAACAASPALAHDLVSSFSFDGRERKYLLHVRYEGGVGSKRFPGAAPRADRSVADAVATWVRLDACDPAPRTETKGPVTKQSYRDCRNGTEVVLYAIAGQGHAWPGGLPGIRDGNVDPPTREISATDLIIDFFSRTRSDSELCCR